MNDQELNELFDAARNEKSLTSANDILKQTAPLEPVHPKGFGKLFKLLSVAVAAAVIGILLLLPSKNNDSITKDSKETQITSLLSNENTKNNVVNNGTSPVEETADSIEPKSPNFTGNVNKKIPDSQKTKRRNYKTNPFDLHRWVDAPELPGDIDKLLAMQELESEVFEIDTDKDTVITTKNGSKFFIESESFCNRLMQKTKGKIKFESKSCFSPGEFMRENLSTSDGKILLESGGMFFMQATQGEDTLQIRKGYEIGYNPGIEVDERMDLYYGNRDQDQNITWKKDPLGEVPTPVFIAVRGKYGDVFNNYFFKNYKLDKEDMVALYDTNWTTHFTSYFGKLYGTGSCSDKLGPFFSACEMFNLVLSPEMVSFPEVKPASFVTQFEFRGMSKNQYAYAQDKGFIDSFRNFMSPTVLNKLNIPLFYPRNMGWSNMDCVPPNMVKAMKAYAKLPKTDLRFALPQGLKVNSYIYLPEQNSIDRASNTNLQGIEFANTPDNHKAYLVVTSLYKDVFYVYKTEFNTSSPETVDIKFETIHDAEEYLSWLNNAVPKNKQTS